VDLVEANKNVFGSITPQHLTGTYEQMLKSPHNHCKPVWPTEANRQSLLQAIAREGQRKFFAGTDSAPHLASRKENENPPPNGCFSAPTALQLYAQAFAEANMNVRSVSRFLYENAANFYGYGRDVNYLDGWWYKGRNWTITDEKFPQLTLTNESPSHLPYMNLHPFSNNRKLTSGDQIIPLTSGGSPLKFKIN